MMEKVNLNFSIEKLENNYWGIAPKDASGLIESCYDIRTKKLQNLDTNDLRLCLGQNMGLAYVVPLAIDVLQENPFVEALYYEGDLLKSLLEIENSFWNHNDLMKKIVINIIKKAKQELENLDTTDDIRNKLLICMSSFPVGDEDVH